MKSPLEPSIRSSKYPIIIAIVALFVVTIATAIILALHFTAQPASQTDETVSTPDIPGTEPPYRFDYSWSDQSPYIAHALGGILGDTYTNSYEAFLLNYQLGHRLFEVDLRLLNQDTLVATHDAPAGDFLSTLVKDKYRPLSFSIIARILAQYPDVYLLTDTLSTNPDSITATFTTIIQTARSIDESILDRLVVQIYNQSMLDTVMALYPWKSVIYTLYADPTWTPENVRDFALASGVRYITMWENLVTPEITQLWHAAGIKIGAHTVNSLATADRLRSLGVNNIYTDFLIP